MWEIVLELSIFILQKFDQYYFEKKVYYPFCCIPYVKTICNCPQVKVVRPKATSTMSQNLYKVERIVGKKFNKKNQILYRVKWVGYPQSQNTWEPVSHLKGVQDMIKDFQVRNARKISEVFGSQNNSNLKNAEDAVIKQRPIREGPTRDAISKTPIKQDQPRKLIRRPERFAEQDEKDGSSSNDKVSELQDFFTKPTEEIQNDQIPAELNLSFLQAKILELAQKKQDEALKILQMYKDGDKYTYQVQKGGNTNIVSRQFLIQNHIDELLSFYESKIQFQERNN